MQLTRAADYAVRVMLELELNPGGGRMTQDELAERAQVPVQFLGKVLQSLARAGLTHSYRGVQGGFELTRRGAEINLLQIVEAVEGPIHLDARFAVVQNAPPVRAMVTHQVWRNAELAMTGVLRQASLEDLAQMAMAAQSAPPEVIVPLALAPDEALLAELPEALEGAVAGAH